MREEGGRGGQVGDVGLAPVNDAGLVVGQALGEQLEKLLAILLGELGGILAHGLKATQHLGEEVVVAGAVSDGQGLEMQNCFKCGVLPHVELVVTLMAWYWLMRVP